MTVKELLFVMPEIERVKIFRKINPNTYVVSDCIPCQSVTEIYGNNRVVKATAVTSDYLYIYIKGN